jgi:hypothetical protein
VGRSCDVDRMLRGVKVPADTSRGGITAILEVGAYQEVSMSHFNAMPRPTTLLVSGDEINFVRKAESQDDVFARDKLLVAAAGSLALAAKQLREKRNMVDTAVDDIAAQLAALDPAIRSAVVTRLTRYPVK